MDLRFIRELVEWLDATGVVFERGLRDDEVESLETAYAFRFPPDLRKLLQYALPVSERFPHWRGRPAALRDALQWPVAGVLREVKAQRYWAAAWGERPRAEVEALAVAETLLAAAPLLIPVYAHRYLPSEPQQAGNPVFSIVGTDVIYVGCDLASFFTTEFGAPCPAWAASVPRPIAFWDALVA